MSEWHDNPAGGKPPAASASGGAGRGGPADWPPRADPPRYRVVLWPNRSLGQRGRRTVMGLLALGLSVPMIPALGTPVFWGLLPFALVAFGALWMSFRRNDADARLSEELTLWPDEMRVERREPSGRVLRWRADPFFVRLTLHEDGKVEKYLTLKGGGREIELGAFLSPDERVRLAAEVEDAIRAALSQGAVAPQ